MKKLFIPLIWLLFSQVGYSGLFFVSDPSHPVFPGDNSFPGTQRDSAWATIDWAITQVAAGDSILVLIGDYALTADLTFNSNGTFEDRVNWYAEANNVEIFVPQGEIWKINFSASFNNFHGFFFDGNSTEADRLFRITGGTDSLVFRECTFRKLSFGSTSIMWNMNTSSASPRFYKCLFYGNNDFCNETGGAKPKPEFYNCTWSFNGNFGRPASSLNNFILFDCVIFANALAQTGDATPQWTADNCYFFPTSGNYVVSGSSGTTFDDWNLFTRFTNFDGVLPQNDVGFTFSNRSTIITQRPFYTFNVATSRVFRAAKRTLGKDLTLPSIGSLQPAALTILGQ